MELKGKNILFISPEFFGVDHSIMNELKNRGANVTWFDERSVKSSFGRALNSLSSRFFSIHSDNYYKEKIESINNSIDIILVIKGEMISSKTIGLFRKKWPSAQMFLYFYDPVDNIKGILNKVSLYDRVISFEPKDCEMYGFEFRPLFCDFSVDDLKNKQESNDFDICFYGTMYGDRFNVVYQMREYCKNHGLRFYSFCYLRGKFMSTYYSITNAGYRKLGKDIISFKPKPAAELANIVKKSSIILDVNDIKQQGLTIRTLETLLLGKKMITTNVDIKHYDFYNPANICIVDRANIIIPESFLNSEYQIVDETILNKYTAKGWVDDVFR